MPEVVAVQADGEGESGPNWLRSAAQTIGVFLLVQLGMKMMSGGFSPQAGVPVNGTAAVVKPSSVPDFNDGASDDLRTPYHDIHPAFIHPMWKEDTAMDISLYVSSSLKLGLLKLLPSDTLVMHEKNVKLGNWSESRDISTSFSVPAEVYDGGFVWGHFFIAKSGREIDSLAPGFDPATAYHFVRPLIEYHPKKKVVKKRNLLSKTDEEEMDIKEEASESSPLMAAYYHGNFTLSVIPDSGTIQWNTLQPAMRENLVLEATNTRDASGQNAWYYPIIYLNTFWQLRSHMTQLNSTVTHLPLNIHLNSLSNWKFNLMSGMDYNMKQNAKKAALGQSVPGTGDGTEIEEIKRVLLDSNIYLLGTTFIASIFHFIFEILAFKSDVSHFRNKKDNVGVSVRTILANVVMQLIIFLYLVDNTDNTSWMILLGQGMGILVEAWKITKTVDVRLRPTAADSTSWFWKYLPYTVVFEDKHKLSETEKKTQEYDEIAFTYLFYVAIPLLLAYAAYSLAYDTHKSWYSFIITTLVGSVYAYGFLMMVPSLYINYRLGSVAHMPARAMTYKFLNTFIDDLFAFTIKMPTLHRLATLRDDVIFFVYLYQSWKYKVDYTRVNEFGQGGDDEEVVEKLASKPLTAPAGGEVDGKVEKLLEEQIDVSKDGKTSGKFTGAAKKRK